MATSDSVELAGGPHLNRLGEAAINDKPPGQMKWARVAVPSVADLIELETRVDYVIPKYDDIVICAYDPAKFGASIAMDALRTHAVVTIGGLLRGSPFFVPPDWAARMAS